ncbi:VTC domain-containing protein [Demequina sp.]|uniref:VTC domain-containing protein n=1 Tax=Demequina sp. TaxID=2050685 RepID=UPI003D0C303B
MTWDLVIAPWRGIALEQLDAASELQTRTDRKYIVDEVTLASALSSVAPGAVLEVAGSREQAYSSTYFDTPELTSYRAAAHRRPRRYKVRTRSYIGSDQHAVELKLRDARGTTVKHREWLDGAVTATLGEDARRFLTSFPDVAGAVDQLVPSLTTTYRRTTLVTPNGRVTIDADVTATMHGSSISFAPELIVETKAARHAGEVDRALWALGVRPSRVSKYCTSLAALNPQLPSNRWSRTLRRHLDSPASVAFAA